MGPAAETKRRDEGQEQGSEIGNAKSELSAYKNCSEISTTLADSAYSSQGTSTYSSLASLREHQPGLQPGRSSESRCSFAAFKKLSSKSSKSNSSYSKSSSQPQQSIPQPSTSQNDSGLPFPKETTQTTNERDFRRRKQKPRCSIPLEGLEKPGYPTSQESKALKVATLSQALGFVDQFRKCQSLKVDKTKEELELEDLATNLLEASQGAVPSSSGFPSSLESRHGGSEDTDVNSTEKKKEGDGFCVAVSLADGQVTHTTSSITNVLGYPKDMLVGRSFIDFVSPHDRGTFISQVTENINLPLRNFTEGSKIGSKEAETKSGSFFCRIRIYNGLKSGFSIKERKTRYNPFKLSVCFSEMNKDTGSSSRIELCSPTFYIFITAIPIVTAYSESFEEGPIKLKSGQSSFVSKLNADCKFSWVDEFTISYTGYLPQDIVGEEVFKYIHPEDLGIIKETFEEVMAKHGKPTKSKAVRFKVKNGGYIKVSSWWSSFINPWSRQLEFVHGKHTVLQGPKQPELFGDESTDDDISKSVFKEAEILQNDIKCTLKKTLLTGRTTDCPSNQVTNHKKELSSFMGSLLKEVAKVENSKYGRTANPVVIGSISPHYSDSSDNPPSYNQLAYNENLTRFFNSQPKTLTEKNNEKNDEENTIETSITNEGGSNQSKDKESNSKNGKQSGDGENSFHGSGEQGSGEQLSGEGNGNNSSILQTGASAGQLQQSGDDGMLSQDGSGSGSRLGSGSRAVSSSDNFKPPPLTEELLEVHNKDMEVKMLAKFKEARRTGDIRFLKDSAKQNLKLAKVVDSKRPTGKEEDPYKTNRKTDGTQNTSLSDIQPKLNTIQKHPQHLTESQWMHQMQAAQSSIVPGQDLQWVAQPIVAAHGGTMPNALPQQFPNQFIGVSTVYIPIQGAPPGFMLQQGARYVPMGMMYSPPEVSQDGKGVRQKKGQSAQPELPNCLAVNSCMVVNPNPPKFKRPPSPVTSVKGEPGSALESNASAPNSLKVKANDRAHGSPDLQNQGNDSDPALFDSGSTSSSLYTCLKSSDEFQLKQSSSDTDRSLLEVVPEIPIEPKPILPEPFWNLRVKLSKEVVMNYEMAEDSLEDVLRRDKDMLAVMYQPDLVDQQLGELMTDLEVGVELEEFLEDFASPPTEDENSDCETNELEERTTYQRRRRDHLDKMNIFMEAEAPFPMPRSSGEKNNIINIYGSSKFSKDSCSGSQTSETDGSSKSDRKQPSKKVRFGDTSSLGGRSKTSFDDDREDYFVEDEVSRQQNIKSRKEAAVMTDILEESILDIAKEDLDWAQPELDT